MSLSVNLSQFTDWLHTMYSEWLHCSLCFHPFSPSLYPFLTLNIGKVSNSYIPVSDPKEGTKGFLVSRSTSPIRPLHCVSGFIFFPGTSPLFTRMVVPRSVQWKGEPRQASRESQAAGPWASRAGPSTVHGIRCSNLEWSGCLLTCTGLCSRRFSSTEGWAGP